MAIKATYESEEDIPEEHKDLFVERNDKWEIQVEGVKSQGDVDRVSKANKKLRAENKQLKEQFAPFADLEADGLQEKLDKYDEMETRLTGKGDLDEEKIEKIVNARVAPHLRENKTLKEQVLELTTTNTGLVKEKTTSKVETALRKAGTEGKIRPEAVSDMLNHRGAFEVLDDGSVVTKEAVGVTPGVQPSVWLSEIQQSKPHWWSENVGGGASGSKAGNGQFANNPWHKDRFNMTDQMRMLKGDPAKAEQMKKAAGAK